jgi:hypothetical protein
MSMYACITMMVIGAVVVCGAILSAIRPMPQTDSFSAS